jgi:hypothetical protein
MFVLKERKRLKKLNEKINHIFEERLTRYGVLI